MEVKRVVIFVVSSYPEFSLDVNACFIYKKKLFCDKISILGEELYLKGHLQSIFKELVSVFLNHTVFPVFENSQCLLSLLPAELLLFHPIKNLEKMSLINRTPFG